tara:strand:+ start:54 stop:515 length:462 start_codon:yes stop_codon:yes gene_type:complete
LATKIIKEIDSYDSSYYLKIGIIFIFVLITVYFLFKNTNYKNSVPFIATFNYIEGINSNTDVKISGIKIGSVSKITLSTDGVIVKGYVDRDYNIPKDSILKIKSEGIFGKKTISIEPGFGDFLKKSNEQYVFNQTQDSYSVDMLLRYLNDLNE